MKWLLRNGLCFSLLIVLSVLSHAQPSPRNMHSMTYDLKAKHILLFGGAIENDQYSNELWSYNGKEWKLLSNNGPEAREDAMLVYDAERNKTWLFGGRTNTTHFTDCWEWDGQAWKKNALSIPFGARDHASAAYDATLKKILVFGGMNSSYAFTNDLWSWNGTTWEQVPATGELPAARISAAMHYNITRGRITLFGGFTQPNRILNDIWELDGLTWKKINETMPGNALGAVAPAPGFSFMAFGGAIGANPRSLYDGCNIWDGKSWITYEGAKPPKRFMHAMAYDPVQKKTYLFGGNSDGKPMNDLWEWDGKTWTRK